jgi:hypothetical protein
VENAPVPTLHPGEMKDLIRRSAKEASLSPEEAKRIRGVLPQEIRPNKKQSDENA